MPAVRIFDELRKRVIAQNGILPAEKKAMYFFQNYASALNTWQRKYKNMKFDFLKEEASFTKQVVSSNGAQPGFLYFFMYDPKLKQELPYYDKFPFVLVLHVKSDRFLGLNFHYLDYYHRARLFDMLYRFREGRKSRPTVRDIRMRLRVSYQLLKLSTKYKAFKPTIKCYLKNHLTTPMLKVGAREWDVALFLPVHLFEKRTATYVWRESEKKIR